MYHADVSQKLSASRSCIPRCAGCRAPRLAHAPRGLPASSTDALQRLDLPNVHEIHPETWGVLRIVGSRVYTGSHRYLSAGWWVPSYGRTIRTRVHPYTTCCWGRSGWRRYRRQSELLESFSASTRITFESLRSPSQHYPQGEGQAVELIAKKAPQHKGVAAG